jgi:hypothetical protein
MGEHATHDNQNTQKVPITAVMDIFALGLTVFELLNPRQKSLWEEFGVDV